MSPRSLIELLQCVLGGLFESRQERKRPFENEEQGNIKNEEFLCLYGGGDNTQAEERTRTPVELFLGRCFETDAKRDAQKPAGIQSRYYYCFDYYCYYF